MLALRKDNFAILQPAARRLRGDGISILGTNSGAVNSANNNNNNNNDNPSNDDPSDNGNNPPISPIWKWTKPGSVYPRKRGPWTVELGAALEHGEWNAGSGLLILVRGVKRRTVEEVSGGLWEGRVTGLLGQLR